MNDLPRLCYVGDVPVEPSLHGSALLWRLLHGYPRERLLVLECEYTSHPEGRLPGVRYESASLRGGRLLRSRLAPRALPFLFRFSRALSSPIRLKVEAFEPDAILTVANGIHWKVAAEIAADLGVPLHLVVHDALLQMVAPGSTLKAEIDEAFARAYAAAASRLCVSPYMAEAFERRFGAPGVVLYPSRAPGALAFTTPSERAATQVGPLSAAFAGTIYPSYAKGLAQLALSLRARGGRLLIFGPVDAAAGAQLGLAMDNVEFRGMMDSDRLKAACRSEADFLFLPMSFEVAERPNMEIAFPSKLADYTATGCPMLIWGPPYCSAVRWARENPGVAEVVDSADAAGLERALDDLAVAPARLRLAGAALAAGESFFSAARAEATLRSALVGVR